MAQTNLSFVDTIKLQFALKFKTDYRENRLSFFYRLLAYGILFPILLSIVFGILGLAVVHDKDSVLSLIYGGLFAITFLVYGFFALAITITSTVRRLHDLGLSGLVLLWVFLASLALSLIAIGPLVMVGFNLYLLFADTKREQHKFSHLPNPFLV
ncbi:hypothetical protein CJP74_07280 [Psittacicella melopsittaci]|uniref:DUF805 domain-containing protein n=1 Tax=Psittacicella melopsittaci TaxID=2028576 RepID=A0A3A1Y5H8_9GAMM|nr:DUF805 domain-containing protein [Psittacicella melopsittaci]RIY31437.1 hypothetical protein CJP74_07280 [Psittacicella melopsittaci]